MRKLILKMLMSLDGFVGSPGNELTTMFAAPDEAAMAWNVEILSNASLHIMGSHSFRAMAAFYPTCSLPFATPMNRIPKAVFSKQGKAILPAANAATPDAESWAQARVLSGDLSDEIRKLKAEDGKPIIAHGGSTFAGSLVVSGLIDEYHLVVRPGALGKGEALFSNLETPVRLDLIKSTPFPSGSIVQVYRPA